MVIGPVSAGPDYRCVIGIRNQDWAQPCRASVEPIPNCCNDGEYLDLPPPSATRKIPNIPAGLTARVIQAIGYSVGVSPIHQWSSDCSPFKEDD